MNDGCWILELQWTFVAWISKHTVKRTKRELERKLNGQNYRAGFSADHPGVKALHFCLSSACIACSRAGPGFRRTEASQATASIH